MNLVYKLMIGVGAVTSAATLSPNFDDNGFSLVDEAAAQTCGTSAACPPPPPPPPPPPVTPPSECGPTGCGTPPPPPPPPPVVGGNGGNGYGGNASTGPVTVQTGVSVSTAVETGDVTQSQTQSVRGGDQNVTTGPVTVEGSTTNYRQAASSAVAPTVIASSTCGTGWSVGGQIIGGGASFGRTGVSKSCLATITGESARQFDANTLRQLRQDFINSCDLDGAQAVQDVLFEKLNVPVRSVVRLPAECFAPAPAAVVVEPAAPAPMMEAPAEIIGEVAPRRAARRAAPALTQ